MKKELTEQQRLDKFRKGFNKLAQKYGFDFQAQLGIVRLPKEQPKEPPKESLKEQKPEVKQ